MDAPIKHAQVVIDPVAGGMRVVHNAQTRKYFRMGEREASFLEALDGSASLEQLQQHNASGFNPAEVAHLLAWFDTHGLTGVTAEVAAPRSRMAAFMSGPDKWRIHLFDPNALLERHIGAVHALFSRPALACYLAILLLPALVFASVPGLMEQAATSYAVPLTAMQWAGLYLAMLAMIAGHEMAHAITCKHFGGKVHKIGVMLLYLQPVVYCDVSDSWRFREVEKKIAVTAAGMFVQLLVSCVVISIWALTGGSQLLYFAVINVAIAVFNLFPLLKLDGYWMLVHILDEPNLRHKGFEAVARALRGGSTGPVHPALLAFGAATILAVASFWCMGLYTIYRYSSRLSEVLALALVVAFGLYAVLRSWTFARSHLVPVH